MNLIAALTPVAFHTKKGEVTIRLTTAAGDKLYTLEKKDYLTFLNKQEQKACLVQFNDYTLDENETLISFEVITSPSLRPQKIEVPLGYVLTIGVRGKLKAEHPLAPEQPSHG
jgi:uncharacterized protein YfaQ (DUF2300 family)